MTPEERASPIAEQMCVELVDAVDAQHLPEWNGYRAAVHAEFKALIADAIRAAAEEASPPTDAFGGSLRTELETYRRELPNLLKDTGKWVVIKGTQVIGVYSSHEEASRIGTETLGNVEFLLREIGAKAQVVMLPFLLTSE
jgi:hypothetical protein